MKFSIHHLLVLSLACVCMLSQQSAHAQEPFTSSESVAPSSVTPVDEESQDEVATEATRLSRGAVTIASATFPNENSWYATTTGVFSWNIPTGAVALAVSVSENPFDEPEERYNEITDTVVLDEDSLSNGVQYLHVQFKDEDGWGSVAHRKVQIDVESPQNIEVVVKKNTETPVLGFTSTDVLSGIDRYELEVGTTKKAFLNKADAESGYSFLGYEKGMYLLNVAVYDKAGNKLEVQSPFFIGGGAEGVMPLYAPHQFSLWKLFTVTNALIFLLVSLLFFLYHALHTERMEFNKREVLLKKETEEIRTQIEKIFGALRREIYAQIQSITKKPKLTKNQKEAVIGLENALTVSETLLEKEVIDVQKILR